MTSRSDAELLLLRAERVQLIIALAKAREMLSRYNAEHFAEQGTAWEAAGGVGKDGNPINPPYKHDVLWLARIDTLLENLADGKATE